MKRITVICILLLVIGMLAVPSSSALTYETYLEDINVDSGTTDFDVTYYDSNKSTASGTDYSRNITLPCELANLSGVNTYINISASPATVNLTYNLTVNGDLLNDTDHLNDSNLAVGQWFKWNLTNIRNRGNVDNTSEYLNFTFNFNMTGSNVTIVINASDAAFSSTWLGAQVVTTEAFLSMPEIDDNQAHSSFAVRDKIKITNNMNYTLTDIVMDLTYYSQNITAPEAYRNITTLASSGINNYTVNYSKYGPYVYGAPDENIDEDEHEVEIEIRSHEVLSRIVDWSFYPTAEDYEDYFVTIDYDTLEIRLNNVKLEWEEGTIEMEDMTLTQGLNTFEFTWTEAEVPPVPPAPGPWDWLFEDYGTGIALWMWFIITAIVIGVIATVAYAVKKK